MTTTETEPRAFRAAVANRQVEDLEKLYMDEAGATPLLDREKEVELAKAIEAGREAEARIALNGIAAASSNIAVLRPDRKEDLKKIEAAAAAKEEFITANLLLVVSIAKKFPDRGLPLLDLIQEGNLGLMHALDKFDWRKGFKFSTYATWWIRQAITRGIANDGRTIRISVNYSSEINSMKVQEARLAVELGREPTIDEVAVATDKTPDEIVEMRYYYRATLSLDEPTDEDGEFNLSDIAYDRRVDVADEATNFYVGDFLSEIIDASELTPVEDEVLRLRRSLLDGEVWSLERVSAKTGIGIRRVRAIEDNAMQKIRDYIALKGYEPDMVLPD